MEAEPLPKWMMRRYALLWRTFKNNKFTLDDCINKLKEDKKIVLVLISRLRSMGWLETELDKEDARRRFYKLKPLETVVEMMEA